MEHRALNLLDLRQAACQNLSSTYIQLGLAAGATQLVDTEGFTACVSSLRHPICNFALDLDLNPWACTRLAELAVDHESLCVYHGPADKPVHAAELLERSGFQNAYRLAIMVAEGRPSSEVIDIQKVEDDVERMSLARFMSDQFFGRQRDSFRKRIAEATAGARGLDLYEVLTGRQRVAGVMLADESMMGLYNLCVHPGFRGLGWGVSTVQAVLGLAYELRKNVTLQCEAKLEVWYRHLGFETIGSIEVYNLAEKRRAVIIQEKQP